MRTYIIAEAGVNHNGNIDLARQLIEVAAQAGADAVKFQTFCPDQVVSRHAPKAEYQARTTDQSESQLDMIRKLELSEADHKVLIAHAKVCDITFLSTPFDLPSLHLLTSLLGLQTIKIPSGEITNIPLLLAVSRATQRVILSTGMCTLGDVETALGVLAYGFIEPLATQYETLDFEKAFASELGQQTLRDRVTLLHCTSEYPAPFAEVNLRAMDTLGAAFGLTVGYSDHTPGIHVALAAVARGARVIEKHFTLNRTLPGPDHRASLEPEELQALVRQTRELELALGDGIKRPSASEWKTRAVARKSLLAARQIKMGEVFTVDNLACKRPGTGICAGQWYEVLGKTACRDFEPDDLIILS